MAYLGGDGKRYDMNGNRGVEWGEGNVREQCVMMTMTSPCARITTTRAQHESSKYTAKTFLVIQTFRTVHPPRETGPSVTYPHPWGTTPELMRIRGVKRTGRNLPAHVGTILGT